MAQVNEDALPVHIAVIPDGNRRWARKRGLPAIAGHKEGVETYKKLLSACGARGIRYVTFYAFSTENWNRSEQEVSGLMELVSRYISNFDRVMGDNKDKVRFMVIGDRSQLSPSLVRGIEAVEERTRNNSELTAILCLNYGGRRELAYAARRIAESAVAGDIKTDDISEDMFGRFLYADVPEPDLLIRTSGEERISNFLLWQLAYSELYFTEILWPDFNEAELDKALVAYAGRKRRFGG